MAPISSDEPIQELKPEPVSGYREACIIMLGLLALYLAIALVATPGPVSHHGDDHGKYDQSETHSSQTHGDEKSGKH